MNANQDILGIIWDFGRVLATFDHGKACAELARYSVLSPEEILNISHQESDAPGKRHEAGTLSPVAFFEEMKHRAHLSPELSFEKFSHIWSDIFSENKEIIEIFRLVRPDIRQCILSNTDPLHWNIIRQFPAVRDYFSEEQCIRSYQVGGLKPERKLYERALATLNISPADIHRVAYIEDVREYCEAFQSLGGKAIQYDCRKDSVDSLRQTLAELGALRQEE